MKTKKKNTRVKGIFDLSIIILILIIGVLCCYIIHLILNLENNQEVVVKLNDSDLKEKYKEIVDTYQGGLYAMEDLNSDGIDELIIKTSQVQSEARYVVYSCRTNNKVCEKVIYLGSMPASHSTMYTTDDGSIVVSSGHMNEGKYYVFKIKDNSIELISENDYIVKSNETYRTGDHLVTFGN